MDSAFQQLLSEDSGMVRDGADGPTSARHTRSTRERLLDYKPSPEWRELVKNLGASSLRAAEAWASAPGTTDPPSIAAARVELQRLS